jgi:hypothetical protein
MTQIGKPQISQMDADRFWIVGEQAGERLRPVVLVGGICLERRRPFVTWASLPVGYRRTARK